MNIRQIADTIKEFGRFAGDDGGTTDSRCAALERVAPRLAKQVDHDRLAPINNIAAIRDNTFLKDAHMAFSRLGLPIPAIDSLAMSQQSDLLRELAGVDEALETVEREMIVSKFLDDSAAQLDKLMAETDRITIACAAWQIKQTVNLRHVGLKDMPSRDDKARLDSLLHTLNDILSALTPAERQELDTFITSLAWQKEVALTDVTQVLAKPKQHQTFDEEDIKKSAPTPPMLNNSPLNEADIIELSQMEPLPEATEADKAKVYASFAIGYILAVIAGFLAGMGVTLVTNKIFVGVIAGLVIGTILAKVADSVGTSLWLEYQERLSQQTSRFAKLTAKDIASLLQQWERYQSRLEVFWQEYDDLVAKRKARVEETNISADKFNKDLNKQHGELVEYHKLLLQAISESADEFLTRHPSATPWFTSEPSVSFTVRKRPVERIATRLELLDTALGSSPKLDGKGDGSGLARGKIYWLAGQEGTRTAAAIYLTETLVLGERKIIVIADNSPQHVTPWPAHSASVGKRYRLKEWSGFKDAITLVLQKKPAVVVVDCLNLILPAAKGQELEAAESLKDFGDFKNAVADANCVCIVSSRLPHQGDDNEINAQKLVDVMIRVESFPDEEGELDIYDAIRVIIDRNSCGPDGTWVVLGAGSQGVEAASPPELSTVEADE